MIAVVELGHGSRLQDGISPCTGSWAACSFANCKAVVQWLHRLGSAYHNTISKFLFWGYFVYLVASLAGVSPMPL